MDVAASSRSERRQRDWAGAVLLAVLLLGAVPAQAQDVPQLTVGRLTGEDRPTIDGLVDDAVWSIVEPYSTFTQQEPTDGQPATEQTDLWVLIDQSYLYVAVVCHDSEPYRLVVSQSRRDADSSEGSTSTGMPTGRCVRARLSGAGKPSSRFR